MNGKHLNNDIQLLIYMYVIEVDLREKKLIKFLRIFAADNGVDCRIETPTLDIGDIIIKDHAGSEIFIIERKSLVDLASSLKDGRYREQSHRLTNYPHHNHNIIYLIEGEFSKYTDKYTKIPIKTLKNTIFCLMYYKGYSVLRTDSLLDTAETLVNMVDKMNREKDKRGGFYCDVSNNRIISKAYETKPPSPKQYAAVINKVKKNNITPDNIGEIILSQIPGISSSGSLAIMSHFTDLRHLLNSMHDNPHCLDDVKYKTKSGSTRRINRTSIDSIFKFLMREDKEIMVATKGGDQ